MSVPVSVRWWRRVWESAWKRCGGSGRAGRRTCRPRSILQLELLEGRLAPSATPVAYPDSASTEAPLPVHINVLANDIQQAGITLVPTSVTILTPPSHGSTSVSQGVVTYTPSANFTGLDTFRYAVRDTQGVLSNAPLVSVVVERPAAADDWSQTDGTAPVTIDVLANDMPVPGGTALDPSSVTVVGQPADGTAAVNPDGSITYTANANFYGTDVFHYTVQDAVGGTSLPASVYVRVTAPSAQYVVAGTSGTQPVTINVLAQCSDPLGRQHLVPASVTIVSPPTHGVAVANADGTVTYTANADFSGRDVFSYTISDDQGAVSLPAKVYVGVSCPSAIDQWTDTDGTTPVAVSVLAGASDHAGLQHLVASGVEVVSQPGHGTAVANANGTITYTANAGFIGTDSFQYTISDNLGGISSPATCYVRVNRPSAADLFALTQTTTPVTVNALAQATDPDGNQHLLATGLTIVTPAGNGTAVANSDGSITYTANAGFSGTDTFQYTIADNQGGVSLPATVSVVVSQSGSLAGAAAQTFGSQPVNVSVLAGYTGSAHLVDFTLTLVGNPSHGSTTVNKLNGTITYTAAAGFTGTDTFTYTVHDSTGAAYGPATATVIVKRPIATDDWAGTVGVTPVTLNVLANDSDPLGSQNLVASSVTIAAQPANGTVTVHADGTVTYTAAAGFSGTDVFSYTVRDIEGAVSLPAHVYVRVNLPTVSDRWTQTEGTMPVTLSMLPGASDPAGNQHLVASSVHIVTGPAHGVAVANADGSITYTANAGYSGTDVLQYTISDDNGGVSRPANFYIRVAHPIAIDQWASAYGSTPIIVNVLANATDPLIHNLVSAGVTIVSPPAHGVAVANGDGTVTYTANAGYSGTDSFRFTITDGDGGVSLPAAVYVTVSRPTAGNIVAQANGNTPVTINVLAQALDPSGNQYLTPSGVVITSQPAHGTAFVNYDGTITYTANPGYSGVDTFQYTISDEQGGTSVPATITIMTAPPASHPAAATASVFTAWRPPWEIL